MPGLEPRPDLAGEPSRIADRADFAAALVALRAGRAVSAIAKELATVAARSGTVVPITAKTLYGYFDGTSRPETTQMLVSLLQVLRVPQGGLSAWKAAWARAAVKTRTISSWHPTDLGVHRSITTTTTDGVDQVTTYVRRAHDDRIRTLLAGLTRPRLLVVVGDSSTGKSRTCYEAVAEVLPTWRLLRPAASTPTALTELLSSSLPDRSVIWLNEIQRYLTGFPDAVADAVAAVERSLDVDRRLLLIGSTWPRTWDHLTRRAEDDEATTVGPAADWANLRTVTAERTPPGFADPDDLYNLTEAARHDPALAEALRAAGPDRRVTQTLAGGPLHLDTYHQLASSTEPQQRATWAVLAAAIDAIRLGYSPPVTPDILRSATAGYLTASDRVLPDEWFRTALTTLTTPLRGTRALTPTHTLDSGVGPADGYTPHDYLQQHIDRQRRYEPTPDTLWTALATKLALPAASGVVLAIAAHNRGLYTYEQHFLARSADAGNIRAARLLIDHAADRGDERLLRELADAGDDVAKMRLAERAADRGDERLLRELAGAGDGRAGWLLTVRAADRGDERLLRELADAGYLQANWWLAERAADRGDERPLQELADAGDGHAKWLLAERAADRGDERPLQELADAGYLRANWQLARRAADRGDERLLWALAEDGSDLAATTISRRAAQRGDADTVRKI